MSLKTCQRASVSVLSVLRTPPTPFLCWHPRGATNQKDQKQVFLWQPLQQQYSHLFFCLAATPAWPGMDEAPREKGEDQHRAAHGAWKKIITGTRKLVCFTLLLGIYSRKLFCGFLIKTTRKIINASFYWSMGKQFCQQNLIALFEISRKHGNQRQRCRPLSLHWAVMLSVAGVQLQLCTVYANKTYVKWIKNRMSCGFLAQFLKH